MKLSEIVSRLEHVKEYERYYSALCVFHKDSHPSMLVYKDGWFRCLSCGRSGDLYVLDRKLRGWSSPSMSYKEATDWSPPPKQSNPEKFIFDAHQRLSTYCESLGWYLRMRRIDKRIDGQKLGWHNGWYVIPTFSQDDNITGYILRAGQHIQEATGARYVTHSTSSLYVPDWYLYLSGSYLVVTFGILDALTLTDLRIPSASTMWGKNLRLEDFDQVRKPIVFFPDKGEEEDAIEYYRHLGWRGRIARPEWTDDTKDINDLYMQGNEMEIINSIERAK